jgi:hypothetical protein
MRALADARNRFEARIVDDDAGWRGEILDADGKVLTVRACRDGAEARSFASTVRQHIYWLSEEKFRDYYRM